MPVEFSDWQPGKGDGAFIGQGVDTSYQPPKLADMPPSYSQYAGAHFGELTHGGGLTSQLLGFGELALAKNDNTAPIPAATAKQQAQDAGVPDIDFGKGTTTQSAVSIMIARAQRKAERDEIRASYKPSVFGEVAHELAIGMADPMNLGMSMMPYLGQARLAAKVAEASSIAARAAWRGVAGAAAGSQFMLAAQPLTATARLQEGQQYTIADGVRDTLFGGAFGAGIHVMGGAVHDTFWGFPSKAPLPPGERPPLPGAAVEKPIEPNPVMRPPEAPVLSTIERMSHDKWIAAWGAGEVPFDTSSPWSYNYLTHTKEGKYTPFNEREMPQGIRQTAGLNGSDILSDIDLGLANGLHPNDIVAHLVHMEELNRNPDYASAFDAWIREHELRQQFDADWAKKAGGEPFRAPQTGVKAAIEHTLGGRGAGERSDAIAGAGQLHDLSPEGSDWYRHVQELHQPRPFGEGTTLQVETPEGRYPTYTVLDAAGHQVATASVFHKDGKFLVSQVYVEKAMRRQGVASKLYDAIEGDIHDSGSAKGLSVSNHLTELGMAFRKARHEKTQPSNMTPELVDELSAIDFHNPQRPFKDVPSGSTVEETHALMRQHSAAHAALMRQKVELAERSRLNAPPESPAEIHDRLPEEIKSQAIAAAISDVMQGRPVRAAEVIKVLTARDPKFADSIDMLRALRKGGPAFDDVDARTHWWQGRLGAQAPNVRGLKGVTGVLRELGGIRDTNGTIRLAVGADTKAPAGALVTQKGAGRTERGLEIPEALEKLKSEGYDLSEAELHDALKREWSSDERTLPKDVAERQAAWEADDAHNREMLKAAGVPRNAKRSLQAERIAAYERELANAEQTRIAAATSTLQSRFEDAVKPEGTEIVRKPIDMDVLKQIATDLAGRDVLDERTAAIEKLAEEAHAQLKAIGDERLLTDIDQALKEIDRAQKDYASILDSALSCIYEPGRPTTSTETERNASGKPAEAPKPAEAVAQPAPPPPGRPGDMPRERVADKLPKTPSGEVDEESLSRRLQARYGVDKWEDLPRARQNAIEKYGMPEDPQAAKETMPAQAMRGPDTEPTAQMRAPQTEAMRIIKEHDKTVADLERTVSDRDELRRKISMADAKYHEEMLAHGLGQSFNPNKLDVPAVDKVPPAPSRREELYRTVTTSNDANALRPVLDRARMKAGSDFRPTEREYFDKLNRYLFRPAPDGKPANSQVAAYLNLTGDKLNQPVNIEKFYEAYKERATSKRPGLNGAEVVKDLSAFKRHLHLYGNREGESFGNRTPDEPAVWEITGDKVKLSPYIPGIEAARGQPETMPPAPKPPQVHKGWPKGKKRS